MKPKVEQIAWAVLAPLLVLAIGFSLALFTKLLEQSLVGKIILGLFCLVVLAGVSRMAYTFFSEDDS